MPIKDWESLQYIIKLNYQHKHLTIHYKRSYVCTYVYLEGARICTRITVWIANVAALRMYFSYCPGPFIFTAGIAKGLGFQTHICPYLRTRSRDCENVPYSHVVLVGGYLCNWLLLICIEVEGYPPQDQGYLSGLWSMGGPQVWEREWEESLWPNSIPKSGLKRMLCLASREVILTQLLVNVYETACSNRSGERGSIFINKRSKNRGCIWRKVFSKCV